MSNAPISALSMRYTELVLEYLTVGIANAVAHEELVRGRHTLSPLREQMDATNMVQSLVYYIAGQKHTASYFYPRDWWEALKGRFAPEWFLSRYPVQMTEILVDAWRYWQNGPTVPKNWGREIRILIPRFTPTAYWKDADDSE